MTNQHDSTQLLGLKAAELLHRLLRAFLPLQDHLDESHQQPLSLHWASLLPIFPTLSCFPGEKLIYLTKQE